MKAIELMEILKENPDFEVKLRTGFRYPNMDIKDYTISGLCDVGYSSKVILLESKEDNK